MERLEVCSRYVKSRYRMSSFPESTTVIWRKRALRVIWSHARHTKEQEVRIGRSLTCSTMMSWTSIGKLVPSKTSCHGEDLVAVSS